MSQAFSSLVELLTTRKIRPGLYQGETLDPGWGRVYGGHVLAQALAAATKEVPADRAIHSFHSYFVLPGDINEPISYDVETIRDGGSISTRRVKAMQRDAVIFFMTASFQIGYQGYEHQDEMPSVVPPDGLPPLDELLAQALGKPVATPAFRQSLDIRPVESNFLHLNQVREPTAHVWIKTQEALPDELAIHEFLLAYASDLLFLPTSTFPHGVDYSRRHFQIATVDHSVWFHRPFRFDDWLLYVMRSPSASEGRGYCVGQFFDQPGRLIASTAQEGVIRDRSGLSL